MKINYTLIKSIPNQLGKTLHFLKSISQISSDKLSEMPKQNPYKNMFKSVEISSLASGQWSQSQHQGQASSSSSQ
ncbi:hypothetical protein H5410_053892 [Solanum commersonii]|uniref:Uncharacterized protein n=1 Tax=Solanum commersonii TaxID=4109 RepID=A0A9J5X4P8_SOLCO|nr:hypothetical protein H5410_053892 [Solanum commersonii]